MRVKWNIINFHNFFFDIFPVLGLEVNDGKVISAGTVKPVDSSSGIVQGISVDKNVSFTTKQSSGTTFEVEKQIMPKIVTKKNFCAKVLLKKNLAKKISNLA